MSSRTSAVFPPCSYEFSADLDVKFPLLVILTPTLCTLGIVGNVLTILVFSRPRLRSASAWYFIFLAVSDLGVLLTSIFLYSIEALFEAYQSFLLYRAWFAYVQTLYGLSHVFQVNGVYLTVAATIDRWAFLRTSRKASPRLTSAIIPLIFLLTVALTGTKFFELGVSVNVNCDGRFGMYQMSRSALLQSDLYATVYSLWISTLFFTLLPFGLLLVFNALITWQLTRSTSTNYAAVEATRNFIIKLMCRRVIENMRRRRQKETTVVLLVVVGVFVVCNVPSLVLSLFENFASDVLRAHRWAHMLARDVVHVLAVTNASMNFNVYVVFGKEFRKELVVMMKPTMRTMHGCWERLRLRRRNLYGVELKHVRRVHVQPNWRTRRCSFAMAVTNGLLDSTDCVGSTTSVTLVMRVRSVYDVQGLYHLF